jgi:DNA mismatch repair protein MutL
VRFRDGEAVFAAVQRAVRRAIIDLAQTPSMRGGRYHDLPIGYSDWGSRLSSVRDIQLTMGLDLDSTGDHPRQRANLMPLEADNPEAVPSGPGAPGRPRTLPILRVIGQVSATYIAAEGPVGLYLIDQHAAHERILYERFMEEHTKQGIIAQYALAAQSIHLPPSEAQLVEANLDTLRAVGFDLEGFGPNTFVIRSIPALLADQSPLDAIIAIMDDLERGHQPGGSAAEDKIIKRICKQAAVKAGQILSLDEMQGMIRQLERCHSPLTCPHGRPTMILMTTDQLAREFGRLGV